MHVTLKSYMCIQITSAIALTSQTAWKIKKIWTYWKIQVLFYSRFLTFVGWCSWNSIRLSIASMASRMGRRTGGTMYPGLGPFVGARGQAGCFRVYILNRHAGPIRGQSLVSMIASLKLSIRDSLRPISASAFSEVHAHCHGLRYECEICISQFTYYFWHHANIGYTCLPG